ncbi:MAG: HEPN domain-containing protein [Oscillospiraceae bacterium]
MEINKYDLFKQRIENLSEHFAIVESDGNITPQQEDLIRAFVLLCHAEIENYIEDLATELLENGKERWDTQKTANYNIASLFIESEKIEKNLDTNQKSLQLFSQFRSVIKNNHGIKLHNIKKLFTPLGYALDDFDNLFITELSTFGELRGETAHTSANTQIQNILNFNDVKIKVDHIVTELQTFKNVLHSKV